jgi:hypothetical protein
MFTSALFTFLVVTALRMFLSNSARRIIVVLSQPGFTLTYLIKKLIAISCLIATLSIAVSSSGFQVKSKKIPWYGSDLSPQVLQLALQAFESAGKKRIGKRKILGIIDFSLPSTKPRFWVLDLEQEKLLFYELVSHGKGSGENFATSFSNISGSSQSSLGLYITGSPYIGKHDYSLRLQGLEPEINDNAEARAIVIHGADYVSQSWIDTHNRLGRSNGCPAVRNSVVKELIDKIKDGHLIFAYYPDQQWLSKSKFLN